MELDKIMSKTESTNITLTFPDGNKKKFIKGIKGIDLAYSISKSLGQNAIAIKVNGTPEAHIKFTNLLALSGRFTEL